MDEFKVPRFALKKSLIGPHLPILAEPIQTGSVSPSIGDSKCDLKLQETEKEKEQVHGNVRTEELSERHEQALPPELKLAYAEPQWSGKPQSKSYQLSVVKNGVEVDTIDLSDKCYCVCGRHPSCDIQLQHPSISRHHAILQYRPENDLTSTIQNEATIFSTMPTEAGFYLYDLSSTHGTYLTKNRLQPRCYYRMRIGQSVKFGGSSRIFVLDLKSENSQDVIEAEAEEERTEITQKKRDYEEYLRKAKEEEERRKQKQDDIGATWGMITDDVDERDSDDMQIDPEKEAYYINDPKKALKTFFDREGLDLEYESEDTGPNHSKTFTIKVWLPIYTSTGEPVYATASVKGNKKQAVVECALEACRLLDAEGTLRQSDHSNKRKIKALEENDYYDSDEDNYFDRTGDVENKRKKRMIKAGKLTESVETYQSLSEKLSSVQKEMQKLNNELAKHKQYLACTKGDSLDDYMKVVSAQFDNATVSKMKFKIHQLQNEEGKLIKLVKITAPCKLPTTTSVVRSTQQDDSENNGSTKKEYEISTAMHSIDASKVSQDPKHESNKQETDLIKSHEVSSSKDIAGNKKKTFGLILPQESYKDEPDFPKEKRKATRPQLPKMVKKQLQESPKVPKWDGDVDSNYASWIPPENQTGDGRTKLNDKLGY